MSNTELIVKYSRNINVHKSVTANKNSIHAELLTMGVSMWTFFFIAGLNSNYFQAWTFFPQLVFVVIIPTIILGFITNNKIKKLNVAEAKSRALWTAFYFTIPFLVLDIFYLGLHKDLGMSFLISHWYLTAFYITPWMIVPVLLYVNPRRKSRTTAHSS